jgi:hypothetical protein
MDSLTRVRVRERAGDRCEYCGLLQEDSPLAVLHVEHRSFSSFASSDHGAYHSSMPAVTFPAHYDGRQIVLDEPYDLPANANLMVTLLPSAVETDSEEAWLHATATSDAFAFLADPAEDIYTADDGEPFRDAV